MVAALQRVAKGGLPELLRICIAYVHIPLLEIKLAEKFLGEAAIRHVVAIERHPRGQADPVALGDAAEHVDEVAPARRRALGLHEPGVVWVLGSRLDAGVIEALAEGELTLRGGKGHPAVELELVVHGGCLGDLILAYRLWRAADAHQARHDVHDSVIKPAGVLGVLDVDVRLRAEVGEGASLEVEVDAKEAIEEHGDADRLHRRVVRGDVDAGGGQGILELREVALEFLAEVLLLLLARQLILLRIDIHLHVTLRGGVGGDRGEGALGRLSALGGKVVRREHSIQHFLRRAASPRVHEHIHDVVHGVLAVLVLKVEHLEVGGVIGAPVALGEGAQGLEALGDSRGKAPLAAHVGHDKHVLGTRGLVGAVSAAKLLDGLIRRPGELDGEVLAAALVAETRIRVKRDSRGGCLGDDGHVLAVVHKLVLLAQVDARHGDGLVTIHQVAVARAHLELAVLPHAADLAACEFGHLVHAPQLVDHLVERVLGEVEAVELVFHALLELAQGPPQRARGVVLVGILHIVAGRRARGHGRALDDRGGRLTG
mmetsp:Transcript_22078/g.68804  ORF Transcript_22078/g.68804 Transcript_22078/m.68804 type:complete len:543 (-) Transcript_22078:2445-4073(-)